MMMYRLTAVIALMACLAACDNSTTPPQQNDTTTLQASFELTTVLDTFVNTTVGPSSPDCPNAGATSPCVHSRPYSGATLGGILNFTRGNGNYHVSGHLSGIFCDTWTANGGCTHSSPVDGDYSGVISGTTGPLTASFGGEQTGVGGPSIQMVGAGTGDSASGVISWSISGQQNPPTHRGKFVLKKQ